MTETIEKRYWLKRMPTYKRGRGMRIRYGYLNVTERVFALREAGGEYFVRRVRPTIGVASEEVEVRISSEAYELLSMAMENVYVQNIRYAVTDEYNRYVVDEETHPHGAYLGEPIVNGCLRTDDQAIEIRNKGKVYFMNRKLARRSERREEDVPITKQVFEFLWESEGCRRIEKTRYTIGADGDKNVGNSVWYVDAYSGRFPRLVRAKGIFPVDTVGILPAPIAAVAIKDVTRDVRFRDWHLAANGLSLRWEES